MSNQKKGTPIAVFNILKSIMDAKAKTLNEQVATGRRAKDEQPILQEHIMALRQVISNCRAFDPSERREAEEDLEDKESQFLAVRDRIACGQRAEQELANVHSFNVTYNTACALCVNAGRIRELESQVAEIENKMDVLDEKIWACEINMDDTSRSSETVAQAHSDAAEYMAQYRDLEKNVYKIKEQIKQLKK